MAARLLAGPDQPEYRPLFREVVATAAAAVPARVLGSEGLGSAKTFDARILGTLLGGDIDPALRQAAAAAILQIALHDPSAWSARSSLGARCAGRP